MLEQVLFWIAVYLLIGFVTAVFMTRYVTDFGTNQDKAWAVFVWPLLAPIFGFGGLFIGVSKLIDGCAKLLPPWKKKDGL